MVSLQNISDIPVAGEQNSRLCKVPHREICQETRSYALECYPAINLRCEASCDAPGAFEGWRNVLVPVNEGVLKRITRTFFELGFQEALNEARAPQTVETAPLLGAVAKLTSKALCFFDSLKSRVFPHTREQGISTISLYSETRDWQRSFIRCIVWHPNCFKIAVAGFDDVIRIYTDEPAVVPLLKCGSQKWITAMAWRPYSSAELAVGCQRGICFWTMDNNMHITRCASSQAFFLKHSKGCSISSLQWNSDGTLLCAASIGDTDVLIWNVDKMQSTTLKRVGHPCSMLKWSPNGACLFSATISSVFRVWSADKSWSSERWTINAGHIQSACWSPCSSFLLFVTSEDPTLYRLQFFKDQLFNNGSAPKQALPIADLTKFCVGHREVGGQPQALAWDPSGRYLAISFKDSSCIAVFATGMQKFNLNISPTGFISGIGAEYPSYICFQSRNRKNSATVLTIGWSNGQIQYCPFAD